MTEAQILSDVRYIAARLGVSPDDEDLEGVSNLAAIYADGLQQIRAAPGNWRFIHRKANMTSTSRLSGKAIL